MSTALQTIKADIESVRPRFEFMAGDALSFEREAGFAVQLLMANDYIARIATENRQSVINAVTNVAAIGISLNPARKQAYLVPRDGRICLDISYMGLLDLAIQSGSLLWGQAELVHLADTFTLNGYDRPPTHSRDPFAPDRGPVVGVYVVVKTRDGDYLTTTMTIAEVHDIRNRSAAWKAWKSRNTSCPWVTDEGEMTKKTVIKRAYKLWPKTERFERVERAIEMLNVENDEGLAQEDKGPGYISATAGAMGSLSIEEQAHLRELALELDEVFRAEDSGPGVAFDLIEAQNFEATQKVAFWSLLASDVRSGLKREGDARRKAAA
jgi:recombination protein RecT